MTPSAAPRRISPTLATFLIGLPLSACILCLFHFGPLRDSPFFHYVAYRVQMAEVTLFCCAVGGLLVKLLRLRIEQKACRTPILPRWDGKPVPVDQAAGLLASIDRQPASVQGSYLGQRIRALLEFICQRRSVADIDDQMRSLADLDTHEQENSCPRSDHLGAPCHPRLPWDGARHHGGHQRVTPEALESGIGAVTNGLAEAFDATAVALALTMVTMFLTSLVEKQEQSILETVDKYIDRHSFPLLYVSPRRRHAWPSCSTAPRR